MREPIAQQISCMRSVVDELVVLANSDETSKDVFAEKLDLWAITLRLQLILSAIEADQAAQRFRKHS